MGRNGQGVGRAMWWKLPQLSIIFTVPVDVTTTQHAILTRGRSASAARALSQWPPPLLSGVVLPPLASKAPLSPQATAALHSRGVSSLESRFPAFFSTSTTPLLDQHRPRSTLYCIRGCTAPPQSAQSIMHRTKREPASGSASRAPLAARATPAHSPPHAQTAVQSRGTRPHTSTV